MLIMHPHGELMSVVIVEDSARRSIGINGPLLRIENPHMKNKFIFFADGLQRFQFDLWCFQHFASFKLQPSY
jgi:hypothetical protein